MNRREAGRGEKQRWCGVGIGWYLEMKPASDTQSTSHALAQAIVVWNLRNAFDLYTVRLCGC